MKSGILLFAYNNDQIDYVKLAEWSAERIHRHLNLPVTLVSDCESSSDMFDNQIITQTPESTGRYFSDFDRVVNWKNSNRADAFDLTPYETTLVLDVDYVVASNQLSLLFQHSQDFLTPSLAYDVSGINNFEDLNIVGKFGLPMVWATVLFFKKTSNAELIFRTVKMIRDNWQHYRDLYQISRSTYRNDYAFAIAANLVYGQIANWPNVPWPLASVVPEHNIKQVDCDEFTVHFVTANGKPRRTLLKNIDFHAMGKRDLGAISGN